MTMLLRSYQVCMAAECSRTDLYKFHTEAVKPLARLVHIGHCMGKNSAQLFAVWTQLRCCGNSASG